VIVAEGRGRVKPGSGPGVILFWMARTASSAYSRRLLAASLVFGLFVLLDIALFSWLIFRSFSQREIQRVLLETRHEAETLARQIASQAEGHGKDLFRAIAVEHETQTYIDSVLKQRDIFRDVEIRDKRGVLVYKMVSRSFVPVRPPAEARPPRSPELPPGGISGPIQFKEESRQFEYEVPNVQVPIGDLGTLVVGISGPELSRRIELLRVELVREATLIGVVTLILLTSAYFAVWWLLRRAARLEEQAADAERMAYIGTLASGLAHEIRNPLNSLNLNMQLLEEELSYRGAAAAAVPGGRRLLSITRSEINRLERLVSDFLAYAKPRPLEVEEMPALWLLEHLGELLAGEVQRRGVKLEVEDRSGGARVRVDAGQMTQLLLNVAQNGLAAMEESGRPPVLRLLAYRHGPEVVLELVDNGVGISSEDQGRIFDLFYSTRKGGTGLGLAIVDRIARAHGGRIEIKSSPGAGTSVAVRLPIVAPEVSTRERPALETAGSRAT
jgi:signal transduction histidine kinase